MFRFKAAYLGLYLRPLDYKDESLHDFTERVLNVSQLLPLVLLMLVYYAQWDVHKVDRF